MNLMYRILVGVNAFVTIIAIGSENWQVAARAAVAMVAIGIMWIADEIKGASR